MKSTKILLAALVAGAALNIAAFADGLNLVQIPNGHGQTTALYRNDQPTIALFTGRGVGQAGTSSVAVQTVSKDNGHGQSVLVYRQVK